MSERDHESESDEPEATSGGDTEPKADESEQQRQTDLAAPAERSSRQSAGQASRGLTWLAVLLALAALAVSAWQWYRQQAATAEWPGQQRVEALAEEVDGLAENADGLSERLARLEEGHDERIEELRSSVAGLDDRLVSDGSSFDELREALRTARDDSADIERRLEGLSSTTQQELQRLEDAIDSRPGSDAPAEDEANDLQRRLVLLEVAGLLRLGASRAVLADDRHGAVAVYREALERLEAAGSDDLARVRGRVADELEALEAVQVPDWMRIGERIETLAASMDDWPRARSGTREPVEAADASEESGWWQEFKRSLGGLVRVSRRDPAGLEPAAFEALAERIRLRLLSARLAAERGDVDAMKSHLSGVPALIERAYEPTAPAVEEAMSTIASLRRVEPAQWPELGSALAAIERQLDTP